MRIFLLGFMGSGKSFSGQKLAERFSLFFVDLDDHIEAKEGRTISAIFEEEGEDYFRKIEQECLHEMENLNMVIVSTGGGTPCFFDNVKWMNEHGITIFLETPSELLAKRLAPEMEHRPLLKDFSQKELIEFIEKKLEERNPFYYQSQMVYVQKKEGQDFAEDLKGYLAPSP